MTTQIPADQVKKYVKSDADDKQIKKQAQQKKQQAEKDKAKRESLGYSLLCQQQDSCVVSLTACTGQVSLCSLRCQVPDRDQGLPQVNDKG